MSVLGFRKLKTDVVSFGITVNVSTPSTYTSAYETNHFGVEPFVWGDFKIYGLSPVFTRQDGELTIISDCEAEGVRGLAPLNIIKLIEDSPIFNITSYSNDNVSDWLEINTISVNTVTLKAGTYRFNDVLNNVPEGTFDIPFIVPDLQNIPEIPFYSFTKIVIEYNQNGVDFSLIYATDNDSQFIPVYCYGDILSSAFGFSGWISADGLSVQTHTITEDTEVDDTFGSWYISSTNYNEVNAKPLAEITYNGETIAQLNAGETAVLKCAGLPVVTDITVKVNG